MKARLVIISALLLILTACSETTLVAQSFKSVSGRQQTYKVGKPYTVMGQRYTPKEDWNYVETGIASWYGDDFHAQRTANGDRFNMWELTAAHRTLPMPSIVRVTNLENGRSIQVVVNDRGPFKRGRIIDVSKRAAQLLGFDGNGTAKVRVEIAKEESMALKAKLTGQSVQDVQTAAREEFIMPEVKPEPQPHVDVAEVYPKAVTATPLPGNKPSTFELDKQEKMVKVAPVKPSNIYVQLASFSQSENAEKLRAQASTLGQTSVIQAVINGKNYYRVRIGPIASVDVADSILTKAVQAGHRDSKIIVD